jgi:hypothetical protein
MPEFAGRTIGDLTRLAQRNWYKPDRLKQLLTQSHHAAGNRSIDRGELRTLQIRLKKRIKECRSESAMETTDTTS